MTIQVSSRRLSYFSCLPNRQMSSFMSILGQGINYSNIHNLLSSSTHIPFSVMHAFNNLLFSLYIYIYNQKRKERAARVFPLFVLFHPRAYTTAVAFHDLSLFHFPWMLDQSLLVMTLSVFSLFHTSKPWSLSTWFVSAARTPPSH